MCVFRKTHTQESFRRRVKLIPGIRKIHLLKLFNYHICRWRVTFHKDSVLQPIYGSSTTINRIWSSPNMWYRASSRERRAHRSPCTDDTYTNSRYLLNDVYFSQWFVDLIAHHAHNKPMPSDYPTMSLVYRMSLTICVFLYLNHKIWNKLWSSRIESCYIKDFAVWGISYTELIYAHSTNN